MKKMGMLLLLVLFLLASSVLAIETAVASQGDSKLDLFILKENSIYYVQHDQGWQSPIDLTQRYGFPIAKKGLSAVSWGQNRIDVFYVGEDNKIKQMWFDGTWHISLHDLIATDTAITSYARGELDLFWVAPLGKVKTKKYSNGWHGDIALGGNDITSKNYGLSADALSRDNIDLAYIKSAGEQLTSIIYPFSGSVSVKNLATAVTDTAVSSWDDTRADIFYLREGGVLGHRWNHPLWEGNEDLTTKNPDFVKPKEGLSAVSWGVGRIDTFYVDEENEVQQIYYSSGSWKKGRTFQTESLEICDNNVDDDGDSLVDCADSDCDSVAGCSENCRNEIDDNRNGLIDCADQICTNTDYCNEQQLILENPCGGEDSTHVCITTAYSTLGDRTNLFNDGNEACNWIGEECVDLEYSIESITEEQRWFSASQALAMDCDYNIESDNVIILRASCTDDSLEETEPIVNACDDLESDEVCMYKLGEEYYRNGNDACLRVNANECEDIYRYDQPGSWEKIESACSFDWGEINEDYLNEWIIKAVCTGVSCEGEDCEETELETETSCSEGELLTLSYVPWVSNETDPGEDYVACCPSGYCVYEGVCYGQNWVSGTGSTICGDDNDWDYCGSGYSSEGEFSNSGNHYCDGQRWVPIELICNDGLDNDGDDQSAGLSPGSAIYIPGQQVESSWLARAWNRLTNLFSGNIAGEAGFQSGPGQFGPDLDLEVNANAEELENNRGNIVCNDPDRSYSPHYSADWQNFNEESLFTQTKVTRRQLAIEDRCLSFSGQKKIYEAYCYNQTRISGKAMDCPDGTSCDEGACEIPPTQEMLSDDPDNPSPNMSGVTETELPPFPGTDCFDSDCIGVNKTGPNNALCCSRDSDCNEGAVCGIDNECKETICNDKVDNDGDGIDKIDCQDPDCNNKQCGDGLICSNNVCTGIRGPGQARIQSEAIVPIFSYKELLNELNKCELKEGTGSCDSICGTQTCIFADGGRNSCSESGSTKCTCC
jgi:hypothetical protein